MKMRDDNGFWYGRVGQCSSQGPPSLALNWLLEVQDIRTEEWVWLLNSKHRRKTSSEYPLEIEAKHGGGKPGFVTSVSNLQHSGLYPSHSLHSFDIGSK